MKRIPKEWDEACGKCGGTGTVHKRERFALMTPEEHAPHPIVLDIELAADVPEDAVVCKAYGGCTIFEACKEAVDVSLRNSLRPVAFAFNGHLAIVRAGDDPDEVAKAWWQRAYGKTHEQSMQNR